MVVDKRGLPTPKEKGASLDTSTRDSFHGGLRAKAQARKAPEAGESSGPPPAEPVLKTQVKEATGMMLFDIELGQPLEISTTTLLETGLPAGIPQAEGAPGKMPIKSVSVQKLIGVEDLKKAAAGGKSESKSKHAMFCGKLNLPTVLQLLRTPTQYHRCR